MLKREDWYASGYPNVTLIAIEKIIGSYLMIILVNAFVIYLTMSSRSTETTEILDNRVLGARNLATAIRCMFLGNLDKVTPSSKT